MLQFLKVEYHLPHGSRRIQNISSVTFESPPPPQRQRIDITGSFEPIGSGEPDLTGNISSAPITTRIEYLQAEGFLRPFNPPLTRTNTPVVVKIPNQRE